MRRVRQFGGGGESIRRLDLGVTEGAESASALRSGIGKARSIVSLGIWE